MLARIYVQTIRHSTYNCVLPVRDASILPWSEKLQKQKHMFQFHPIPGLKKTTHITLEKSKRTAQ